MKARKDVATARKRPERRYEMVVAPSLLERAGRQAERVGLSLAAYVRQALAQRVEADEATDPNRRSGS